MCDDVIETSNVAWGCGGLACLGAGVGVGRGLRGAGGRVGCVVQGG